MTTSASKATSTPSLPPITPEHRSLLEEDILRRGVMVPILVAQDGEVIDGRLRHEIAVEHGLTCPKILVGRLTDEDRADLRLAVNLYRRHLTQAQVRELVAWDLRRRPEASDRCVAKRTGVNHRTVAGVRRSLEERGEILHLPERAGADGKRYPVVITNGEPQARAAARLLHELGEDAPDGHVNVRTLKTLAHKKRVEAEASGPEAELPTNITIIRADVMKYDWSPYEGRARLAIVDAPWERDDDLPRALAEICHKVLAENGVACVYSGQASMPAWLEAFGRMLKYEWLLVSLNTGDGKVRCHGAAKTPICSAFRPILVFSKGVLRSEKMIQDVLRVPADKGNHPQGWDQPSEEVRRLVDTFTAVGDLVVSPCCGVNTAVGVVACAGREFVGVDADVQVVKLARRRVAEAVKPR